jgi:hypothetical protein
VERKNTLNGLLEIALLENKSKFVSLLLEQKIDLSKFLNNDRLKNLYNNEAVRNLFELIILIREFFCSIKKKQNQQNHLFYILKWYKSKQ